MPSNFTPNYSLNQWEASDKVQRVDFNADNAKIDAALAGKLGRTELHYTFHRLDESPAGFSSSSCNFLISDWSVWEYVFVNFWVAPGDHTATKTKLQLYPGGNNVLEMPYGSFTLVLPVHHDPDGYIRGFAIGSGCGSFFFPDHTFKEFRGFGHFLDGDAPAVWITVTGIH